MRSVALTQFLKTFFVLALSSAPSALADAAASDWPARKGLDVPGPIDSAWSSAEIRSRCNPAAIPGQECYREPDCRVITVAHVEVDKAGVKRPVFIDLTACQVPETDQNSEHSALFDYVREQQAANVPKGQIFYWVMGLVSGSTPEFQKKTLERVAKDLGMPAAPALRFEADIPLSLLFKNMNGPKEKQAAKRGPRPSRRDAF